MKYYLFAAAILIGLFSFTPTYALASTSPENRSTETILACTKWLNARSVNDAAVFHSVSNTLGCYDGDIGHEAGEKLIEWLTKNSLQEPLLVVRSRGGLVSAGLSIGQAIAHSQATVLVFEICGSSCANYIFSVAKKRIVHSRSVVLFHGGMSKAKVEEGMVLARAKINEIISDPEKAALNIQSIEQTLNAQLKDQRALMLQVGVTPKFFERYSKADIVSLPDDHCTSGYARNFVFLTKRQYKRIGIEVIGELTDSIDDVEEIVGSLDIGNPSVCAAPELLFSDNLIN